MERLGPFAYSAAQGWKPACFIFVTPSFSKWLSDDTVFLRPALARLLRLNGQSIPLSGNDNSVHVLVAVVDKLGLTRNITGNDNLGAIKLSQGYDGIACLLTDQQNINLREDYGHQESSEKNVVFNFRLNQCHRLPGAEQGDWLSPYSSTVVKLPLANTIFQTGQLATLRHSEWKWSNSISEWQRENPTKELAHVSLSWPSSLRDDTTNQELGLSIGLVPLTVPRRVDASMGNIVRQLSNGFKPIPASQELEASISEYFKARKTPPHPLSVWALVSPALAVDSDDSGFVQQQIRDNWSRNIPVMSDAINSALVNGSRLHKVLSGGGGWGKKAGLISLDPGLGTSSAFGPEDTSLTQADGEEEMLTQVAKPGDYLQFLIPSILNPDASFEHEPRMKSDSTEAQELSIGVIPSAIDEIPAPSAETSDGVPEFTVSKSECKILTESSIDLQLKHSSGPTKKVHTFKLDVPNTRLLSRTFTARDVKNAPMHSSSGSTRTSPNSHPTSGVQRRHFSEQTSQISSSSPNPNLDFSSLPSGFRIRTYESSRSAINGPAQPSSGASPSDTRDLNSNQDSAHNQQSSAPVDLKDAHYGMKNTQILRPESKVFPCSVQDCNILVAHDSVGKGVTDAGYVWRRFEKTMQAIRLYKARRDHEEMKLKQQSRLQHQSRPSKTNCHVTGTTKDIGYISKQSTESSQALATHEKHKASLKTVKAIQAAKKLGFKLQKRPRYRIRWLKSISHTLGFSKKRVKAKLVYEKRKLWGKLTRTTPSDEDVAPKPHEFYTRWLKLDDSVPEASNDKRHTDQQIGKRMKAMQAYEELKTKDRRPLGLHYEPFRSRDRTSATDSPNLNSRRRRRRRALRAHIQRQQRPLGDRLRWLVSSDMKRVGFKHSARQVRVPEGLLRWLRVDRKPNSGRVRRLKVTDQADVKAAWDLFDRKERERERGRQRMLTPLDVARRKHWRRHRREGPMEDTGLEVEDLE